MVPPRCAQRTSGRSLSWRPLGKALDPLSDREPLEQAARTGVQYRRLPRIDGAELSPSGQAKCRSCHQPIERGSWRIRLVFYEEGLFSSGGFLHPQCSKTYFETDDIAGPRAPLQFGFECQPD